MTTQTAMTMDIEDYEGWLDVVKCTLKNNNLTLSTVLPKKEVEVIEDGLI